MIIFMLILMLLCIWMILSLGVGDKTFIHKRFWKELEKVAEREEIPVTIHEDMKALNDYIYGEGYAESLIAKNKAGKLACGIYRHNDIQTVKEIHLYNRSDVWTFAHELGHHFAIKFFRDESERGADKFIRTLVKTHMPWWHRMLIPIDISVYAPKK